MINISLYFVSISLVLFTVYGACPYDQYDSVRRNDAFEHASTPFIGKHVGLTLCDDDDDEADWYRTWIKPGNTLRVEIDVAGSVLRPFVQLSMHDDSGVGKWREIRRRFSTRRALASIVSLRRSTRVARQF
jgi:hypothetical protein